jgi:hypothetical protein
MDIYKVYVATKTKLGKVTKSEGLIVNAKDIDDAIDKTQKQAKEWYGYKGKVHICSMFIRNAQKQYDKIELKLIPPNE